MGGRAVKHVACRRFGTEAKECFLRTLGHSDTNRRYLLKTFAIIFAKGGRCTTCLNSRRIGHVYAGESGRSLHCIQQNISM